MATVDPEKEHQRLARLYRGMADGELEKLAADAGSLSDAARETLQAELSRRGSGADLPILAATTEVAEPPGPMVLRRFRDLPDALIAKSILDSANVECFLIDENTIRMDWLWSNFLGGIKLWVRHEDADAAELLDQDYLETFDVGGVGAYKQPRCPTCQSFDVSYRELIKRVAFASMFLIWYAHIGVLIPLRRPGWKCRSCGYAWEWEGLPDDAP